MSEDGTNPSFMTALLRDQRAPRMRGRWSQVFIVPMHNALFFEEAIIIYVVCLYLQSTAIAFCAGNR